MRLDSADGAGLEIRPLRYEFPDRGTPEGQNGEWDANWLWLGSRGWLGEGREWTIEGAELTTWEGQELAQWLLAVAAGSTPELLQFTEPTMVFGPVQVPAGEQVVFQVRFSEVTMASSMSGVLTISTTRDQVARAARQWQEELKAFPQR